LAKARFDPAIDLAYWPFLKGTQRHFPRSLRIQDATNRMPPLSIDGWIALVDVDLNVMMDAKHINNKNK